MDKELRILMLEDVPTDAELTVRELRKAGFAFTVRRVETEGAFVEGIEGFKPDLILADYSLPHFDGLSALAIAKEKCPDVPFILVSGALGEEVAIESLKSGATDYVLKQRLERLGPVATRALREAEDRRERKKAEEELRARNEEIMAMSQQLWQAAKLATMGELAASIAHELNNPLTTVTLRLESLMDQLPVEDPKQRELKIMEGEVERMGSLVANLLQFSRRSQQQISTMDVRHEIDNALDLIHYHLHKYHIAVVREFAQEVPAVHADRGQLRQLFLNLFTNASDAMPKGGTLTIRVREGEKFVNRRIGEPEKGGLASHSPILPLPDSHLPAHVVIEVADTGIGIPPEDLPKVMEPFFTTKPEGKGTGLGLPICRRIAQEHGGTLEIESEVGRGTTVRIGLPVANKAKATIETG